MLQDRRVFICLGELSLNVLVDEHLFVAEESLVLYLAMNISVNAYKF